MPITFYYTFTVYKISLSYALLMAFKLKMSEMLQFQYFMSWICVYVGNISYIIKSFMYIKYIYVYNLLYLFSTPVTFTKIIKKIFTVDCMYVLYHNISYQILKS